MRGFGGATDAFGCACRCPNFTRTNRGLFRGFSDFFLHDFSPISFLFYRGGFPRMYIYALIGDRSQGRNVRNIINVKYKNNIKVI